jgi:hypothetical protein
MRAERSALNVLPAADQRRGEKAVLAHRRVGEHYRERNGEQPSERLADNRAHHRKIRHARPIGGERTLSAMGRTTLKKS